MCASSLLRQVPISAVCPLPISPFGPRLIVSRPSTAAVPVECRAFRGAIARLAGGRVEGARRA
jgi:hypothetical protein